ncbi:hypothetical protein MSG28_014911 [Choristoneura fumiferana]|uniref:Uncharacterized protein n=1 Tax=Choristoneura fumiferana TaxID=7141 RepID=A0ACC0KYM0_CHOFU|nr:hypothetical protein MSG28_014911 [Choristoneura fumiferana]
MVVAMRADLAQVAADAEARSSGRSLEELPSKLGKEVEDSLASLTQAVTHGVARALSRKHHESGGIDSITISTGNQEKKKKMKKKKQKPPKIHLIHPMMMPMKEMEEKGRGFGKTQSWVVGESPRLENATLRKGRNVITDLWNMGEKALDAVAEHAVKRDETEDGISDKSSVEEQRSKKKKKKKAILKLLILGAVLKAKIGTLLQILSFKLQVKFFILALIGLGINLARFWIDLKKTHQPPQKPIYVPLLGTGLLSEQEGLGHSSHAGPVRIGNFTRAIEFLRRYKRVLQVVGPCARSARIATTILLANPAVKHQCLHCCVSAWRVIYYEHAQHQHHYDHEEEPGWGPWSRSMDPIDDSDIDDIDGNTPYRAQDKASTYVRPLLTRV